MPTINLLEVFKRMRQQRGRNAAYRAVAQLWTQDADFAGMNAVRYRPKRSS